MKMDWSFETGRASGQGFTRFEGLNYDITFSIVAILDIVRIIVAYDAYLNLICFRWM